ncbi:hypothetical protein EG329_011361 [Mollisiaceae sp. DMI_Dod_QoI]|nr:hypothetical protein EG329_011361 [Helotiales sp. DMI_Dod_QoI]
METGLRLEASDRYSFSGNRSFSFVIDIQNPSDDSSVPEASGTLSKEDVFKLKGSFVYGSWVNPAQHSQQSNNKESLIPLQTFQDAIWVTQSLGFSYIWIDSLCIVQDDEDDWRQESALMSQVYGNAVVNIAATKAENGSVGLFAERDIHVRDINFVQWGSSDFYEVADLTLY